MAINWNNIRPLNNSLNDGFEELVAQLAKREKIPNQKAFTRIGKPDAGKECYWELDNGNMNAWQAKYFTASWSASQWQQIEDSVMTVIDNHPKLTSLYLAVPMDLSDGAVPKTKSLLKKWKEKVFDWQAHALAKGMHVDFYLWDSSELVTRLSKPGNEGMKHFWFNAEEFTDAWFDQKNEESIVALGLRYTKDLNFELDIARMFSALSRNEDFATQVNAKYEEFFKSYHGIRIDNTDLKIAAIHDDLKSKIKLFRSKYDGVSLRSNDKFPFKELDAILIEIQGYLHGIEILLRDKKPQEKPSGLYEPYDSLQHEIDSLISFQRQVRSLRAFFDSTLCLLANNPFLLLTGPAGVGKSHLLADIVNKRKLNNEISLFLLGSSFTSLEHPWTQILSNQLRKPTIDEFTFLDALNAKAESRRSRTIIFIDAINEGRGNAIWPDKLKAFILLIKKYDWLGVVLSLRSSFIQLIAPKSVMDDSLIVRRDHQGFAGVEYRATHYFFDHYKIIYPSTPLLNPEFQNPLFLKLFCLGIHERGLNRIPEGYEGITKIIDYFLDSINLKLARPSELFYDEKKELVQTAVGKVVHKMNEEHQDDLVYSEANKVVDEVFQNHCSNPEPYLKKLISEGVFNEDIRYEYKEDKHFDIINFAYQRFQDHLTASYILKDINGTTDIETALHDRLSFYIKDFKSIRRYQNIIEAFSIQLPDKFGKEIFEIFPEQEKNNDIANSFLASLIWRKKTSVTPATRDYIRRVVDVHTHLAHLFLETVIESALKPDFDFNAYYLDSWLKSIDRVTRDKIWTIWLSDKYGDDSFSNPVRRLIDWAWNNEDKAFTDDKSIMQACITLGWFCTSSNRYLRDAATKGLICLLERRLHLVVPLLKNFQGVDDPYVCERIFAAVYGSCIRSGYSKEHNFISEYIYREIFLQDIVYEHILLRDYARGVIEFTLLHAQTLAINPLKIRPPYRSKPLPKKFPTIKAIDRAYKPKGKDEDKKWGTTAILSSMTTERGRPRGLYGDFGRYTFQRGFDDFEVDSDSLSNYAVQRIFEMGYDPVLFSEFDRTQGTGRHSGQSERIGKKYQWIAFHELLARVADQLPLTDESAWEDPKDKIPFEGPWYPNVRDIDPTMIIKQKVAYGYKPKINHWTCPMKYDFKKQSAKEWVKETNDIPKAEEILTVSDSNGVEWLWLENYPDWNEKKIPGEDERNAQKRRLWMHTRSYLIRKKDYSKFSKATKNEFHLRMPETRNMYTIFSREYYWSQAFKFFNKSYYSGRDWMNVEHPKTRKPIADVHRTTEEFTWEEEYDLSKKESIRFYKPNNIIFKSLHITQAEQEGEYIDNQKNLICFDPSVNNQAMSGLLIRKDKIVPWLEENDLVLIWDITGEKQALANNFEKGNYPGRLNIIGSYKLEGGKIKGNTIFKHSGD